MNHPFFPIKAKTSFLKIINTVGRHLTVGQKDLKYRIERVKVKAISSLNGF